VRAAPSDLVCGTSLCDNTKCVQGTKQSDALNQEDTPGLPRLFTHKALHDVSIAVCWVPCAMSPHASGRRECSYSDSAKASASSIASIGYTSRW
jgi:hypothetical protein